MNYQGSEPESTNRTYRPLPGGRTNWVGERGVLEHAIGILGEYDTGVTLRQLFYRLVSDGTLPNTDYCYRNLSATSADWRREGRFPDLIDTTRSIARFRSFTGPDQARSWLADVYRRDRTEGQTWSVYLGAEKHGLAAQLVDWFGDLGVPRLTLGGWSSQTYCDQVRKDIERQERPAVFIYAGDFDPSGWFIPEDFIGRVGAFTDALRIGVLPEQVEDLGLKENPAPEKLKTNDARARAFVELFGRVRQVEVDAIPPETLRELYRDAIEDYWESDVYETVLEREESEREDLQ